MNDTDKQLDEFQRFINEMGERARTGQPLVQLPWTWTDAYKQTADGWIRLYPNQQTHKWHLQRRVGTGWADFGQDPYDNPEAAKADAEQAARREASV